MCQCVGIVDCLSKGKRDDFFFLFEKKTTVECSSLYENRCMNIRKENVLVDSPEINNNDSQ